MTCSGAESSESNHLPIDEITMNGLIRLNYLLKQAEYFVSLNNEFDVMTSMVLADAAVESTFRIVSSSFQCGIEKRDSFDEIIKKLNKKMQEKEQKLPNDDDIKHLHTIRNMIQHSGAVANKSYKLLVKSAADFIEDLLMTTYHITREDICLSTLVNNADIQLKAERAESALKNAEYLESIIASRDAYELAFFLAEDEYASILRPRALHDLNSIGEYAIEFIALSDKKSRMTTSGFDISDTERYLACVNAVPISKKAEGSHAFIQSIPENWADENAEFCYRYSINSILYWQNKRVLLSHEEITGDSFEEVGMSESFSINGVSIPQFKHRPNCDYHGVGRLMFVREKELHELSQVFSSSDFVTIHEENSGDDFIKSCDKIAQISGYSKELMINDPAIWEIMLFYKDVPFTELHLLNGRFPEGLLAAENINTPLFFNPKLNDEELKRIAACFSESGKLETVAAAEQLQQYFNELLRSSQAVKNMVYSPTLIRSLLSEHDAEAFLNIVNSANNNEQETSDSH